MAAATSDPLSETELLRLIDDEISASVSFDKDQEKDRRETALEYYRGEMNDLPAATGWSHAVSRDVADVIDTMLPGLLRVFDGSGQIAVYAPNNPEYVTEQGPEGKPVRKDVSGDRAAQATDYVNFIWDSECDGYLVLSTAILDALMVRNGIIKSYWDASPEYDTEDLTGLSDEQIGMLQQDPECEIVGYEGREEIIIDSATGQPVPIALHDVRVRRVINSGRLKIEAVPPEDFGVSKGARTIDKARMVWHRSRPTRSDLLQDGYPREIVEELVPWGSNPGTRIDRDDGSMPEHVAHQAALDEIEVYECYPLVDMDGDGIAERMKVVVAGDAGGRRLLAADPWPDEDTPFIDLVPQIVPHRWMGQSIADNTMDLQRIKTALWRQMLDNLYLVNRPQTEVVQKDIINPDEILNPSIGGVVRVKNAGAIKPLSTPYIGDKALQGIQYTDSVIQRRTGISGATASLDATALEPQTATAEQLEHDASYAKVELVARNMAKLGLKRLFAKMLRIIVRHQDRPRTIRLRDKWVDMDPRAWNAAMDVTINVGLGTGSRERDTMMLSGIASRQELIIKEMGVDNPFVTPEEYISTLHKIVESSGLRDPDAYFKKLTAEEYQQWKAQQPPPPPDPKVQLEQAKMQARQQDGEQKAQIQAGKAAAEIQIKQGKAQADVETDRLKAMTQAELRREEMQLEAQLKQIQLALNHSVALNSATNIARPQ